MTGFRIWLLILSLANTLLLGCGDGRPGRVPVAGHVLIDDEPLDGAFVKFVPGEGRPAIGQTDADGQFSLTCYEPGDGALVGNHQVAVIAVKEISGTAIMWRAPKKYADHRSSGIEVSVEQPKGDLEIHLTWDGGQPFIEREGGGVE